MCKHIINAGGGGASIELNCDKQGIKNQLLRVRFTTYRT